MIIQRFISLWCNQPGVGGGVDPSGTEAARQSAAKVAKTAAAIAREISGLKVAACILYSNEPTSPEGMTAFVAIITSSSSPPPPQSSLLLLNCCYRIYITILRAVRRRIIVILSVQIIKPSAASHWLAVASAAYHIATKHHYCVACTASRIYSTVLLRVIILSYYNSLFIILAPKRRPSAPEYRIYQRAI